MNTTARHRVGCVSALIASVVIELAFASPAHSTAVRSDGSDLRLALFPSDRYTVPDPTQLTGRRVALPKPDCSVNVSDCEDVDVINQLDGFNVQPRIVIPFSGAIDLASISRQSVYLLEVGSSRHIALNQLQWHEPSNTLVGAPDELLRQHRRYLLIVTDDVLDRRGTRLQPAPFWAANHATGLTASDRRYTRALREELGRAGVHREHVAAASLFTTQSVTADLEKIQAQIRQATPSAIDFSIGVDPIKSGQPGGSSVPALFDVESTAAITWHRQTGTDTGAQPLFTDEKVPVGWLALAPGSIAKIAFGRFFSPDYRSAGPNAIPTYPTRNGEPIAQRRVPLMVEIFIPSGPKPSRGWPVALMGHGITSSMYEDAWAIAPQLAAVGIATAAIHYAGHGGGERGTLEVVSRDGRVVLVSSAGRGIDQDGDGRIGPLEGLYAISPQAIVFGRDGTRQTVIDLMQLVREIQVGVDVDGDGYNDLDATRISYVGQSGGAVYGTVLLAIEPLIGVGALNVGGGPSVDIYRLASRGSANKILGRAIAARTPSLLNGTVAEDPAKPSFAFIDNIPLRNQPVAVHSTPGAMEIQQLLDRMSWVSQASNPVAYAPYLRESPLPGRPKKQVLVQFAKGDRSMTNPTTTALVRAGRLTDFTTLYRADLAQTSDPRGMPKNPHNFMLGVDTAEQPFALAAQRQIAAFLASGGTKILDPDGDGDVFETPIKGPLPEDLGFLP